MKQFSISIRHGIWCLIALTTIGWSCRKNNLLQDNNSQTENTIAQARKYYESTATPLTKTFGDQQIPIKPLPGEITPQWERATATVLENGSAFVDVPISTAIVYTAIRQGYHHHEAGEECGHDHSSVQAVQKLTVETLADGSQRSLVATIVPEAGCTIELRNFSSATGLDGFAGFVSWHDLTGNLIRVAKYENGTQIRNAEATGSNETEILEIVDNTFLYPAQGSITKAIGEYCYLCQDNNCLDANNSSVHCRICKKYDNPGYTFDPNSKCKCKRCGTCGERISAGQEYCSKCNTELKMPDFCSICGMPRLGCPHYTGEVGGPSGELPAPFFEHNKMIETGQYVYLTKEQCDQVKTGSQAIDVSYQSEGYEYKHGMYYQGGGDETRQAALTMMSRHFVAWGKEFAKYKSYYSLGEALHPILDTYVPLQTRIDMLSYYSYNRPQSIVNGSQIVYYTHSMTYCTNALKYICTALQNLSSSATESDVANIFYQWLKMTGGGY
ncbi:MAG: hypothetical protein K2G93_07530 [Rikenella sp.]|nr:hypothetical protein [Rikenella sp.]